MSETVTVTIENVWRLQLLQVMFGRQGYGRPSGFASSGAAREAAQLLVRAEVGDTITFPFSPDRLSDMLRPMIEDVREIGMENSEHVVAEGERLLDELEAEAED